MTITITLTITIIIIIFYYYYYYYQCISRPNNWRDFIETMKDKFLIDCDYVFVRKPR